MTGSRVVEMVVDSPLDLQLKEEEEKSELTTMETEEVSAPASTADPQPNGAHPAPLPNGVTNGVNHETQPPVIATTAPPPVDTFPRPVFLSLSIPPSLMPSASDHKPRGPTVFPLCAVSGCEAKKKYRVVLDGGEEKGACGLDHFRVLKGGGTLLLAK